MLEVRNLPDTVLISVHTNKTPNLSLVPHSTGLGCILLYHFPTLPENYSFTLSSSDLALICFHLEKFDELNRLGIATQKAWREFKEGVRHEKG